VTPPLLEVRGVTRRFGGLTALRGVDLTIGARELRCIIGPNGCGKTTLFNVITGEFPPTSGQVFYRGEEITGRSPHEISRRGIARKFQVPSVYPTLSVAENLEIPLVASRGGGRPWAALGSGPAVWPRLRVLLEQFDLGRHTLRPASTLAHGRRQWLEIAMLLARDAQLLLLDEPTAGMSAAETAATASLVRQIQRERGVAVLVIEHDMSFVRQLACPVLVMIRGAVHFEGTYEEAQADPAVREAYLGDAERC
jgi:urea transport system ATP-binding protein